MCHCRRLPVSKVRQWGKIQFLSISRFDQRGETCLWQGIGLQGTLEVLQVSKVSGWQGLMRAQCQGDKTSAKIWCNRLPPKVWGSSKVRGEVLCKSIKETSEVHWKEHLQRTTKDLFTIFQGSQCAAWTWFDQNIWLPRHALQIHIDHWHSHQKYTVDLYLKPMS